MAVETAQFGALLRVVDVDVGGTTEHRISAMEDIQLTAVSTPATTLVHKAMYTSGATLDLYTLDGGAWDGAVVMGMALWAPPENVQPVIVNEGGPGTNRYPNIGQDMLVMPGGHRSMYFVDGGALISAGTRQITFGQPYAGAPPDVWVLIVAGPAPS